MTPVDTHRINLGRAPKPVDLNLPRDHVVPTRERLAHRLQVADSRELKVATD